ncbi:MAG: hypothetical protein K1X29_09835 [Bdellovibrionales bacterium]|nr:hypothetical protein [Bdellovibrionales bacterium]
MKHLFFLNLFLFPLSLFATETSLPQLIQNEWSDLNYQKESLLKQKAQMEKTFTQRISQLKHLVEKMQQEVSQQSAENDVQFERLQKIEKRIKSLGQQESFTQNLYTKMNSFLQQKENELHFNWEKSNETVLSSDSISLANLDSLFTKALLLLKSSAQEEEFTGYFLDEKDHLQKGSLVRQGTVTAFLKDSNESLKPLKPYGKGPLKLIQKSQNNQWYLIGNLNEAARISYASSWIEKLADLGPILFLAIVLGFITALFAMLIKI